MCFPTVCCKGDVHNCPRNMVSSVAMQLSPDSRSLQDYDTTVGLSAQFWKEGDRAWSVGWFWGLGDQMLIVETCSSKNGMKGTSFISLRVQFPASSPSKIYQLFAHSVVRSRRISIPLFYANDNASLIVRLNLGVADIKTRFAS